MFKFELGQTVFFLRHNRIHSAPVLARMVVENHKDDWASTKEQEKLYEPWGKTRTMYKTVHGERPEDLLFGSKEELVQDLLTPKEPAPDGNAETEGT